MVFAAELPTVVRTVYKYISKNPHDTLYTRKLKKHEYNTPYTESGHGYLRRSSDASRASTGAAGELIDKRRPLAIRGGTYG